MKNSWNQHQFNQNKHERSTPKPQPITNLKLLSYSLNLFSIYFRCLWRISICTICFCHFWNVNLSLILFYLLVFISFSYSLSLVYFADMTKTSANATVIPEHTMSLHPYFNFDVQRNVTARVGQTAFLQCKVEQLGDKSVSFSIFVFQLLYLCFL